MPHLLASGQAYWRRLQQWKPLPSHYLQVLSLALLLGLLLREPLSWLSPESLLIAGLCFAPFVFRRYPVGLLAVALIGLGLGAWRAQTVWGEYLVYEQHVDQEVVVEGAAREAATYNDSGQREFVLKDIELNGRDLPGVVQVTTYDNASIQRGDEVRAEGTLRERFGNRAGYIYYADVEKQAALQSPLETFRREFIAGIFSTIRDPENSLGLGFLLGTRVLLPESLSTQLSITGLTHIVAVSGYNLTVLVRLARRLFENISAYWSVAASAGLITVFLLLTGLVPSVFRASVVSFLALGAWYYGRRVSPWTLLFVSAAVTAVFRPSFFWYDLGWWLSFLSFIGVLVIAPIVFARLFRERRPPMLLQILIETSCAQVMALPLVGMIFGEFSLIAVVANVFVLPLVPFAMAVTAVAGAAGMVLPTLAGWLAWPAQLVLSLITSLTTFFSRIPYALAEVEYSPAMLVSLYAIIAFVVGLMRLKLSRKEAETLHQYNIIE